MVVLTEVGVVDARQARGAPRLAGRQEGGEAVAQRHRPNGERHADSQVCRRQRRLQDHLFQSHAPVMNISVCQFIYVLYLYTGCSVFI